MATILAGVMGCAPDRDPPAATAAIIDGTDSADAWVVGIDIAGGGLCTGTLIAPSLVLTARHCVSRTAETIDCSPAGIDAPKVFGNYPASAFRVSTAADYRSGPSFDVRAVYYPNDATCAGSADVACRVCGYDVALLELARGASDFPAEWVSPSSSPPPASGAAIGFGCQDGPPACAIRGYRMSVEPVSVTSVESLEFTVGARVCGGDSGGPFAHRAERIVSGALSRGDAAACTMGVYTRTDVHFAWLQRYGALAASNGGYPAPAWVTSGGSPTDAGSRLPLGARCTGPRDCESAICVDSGGTAVCSRECSSSEPCPDGLECLSTYCLASPTSEPDAASPIDDAGPFVPPSDASPREAAGPVPPAGDARPDARAPSAARDDGCTIGGTRKPARGSMGALVLCLLVLRRRRRSSGLTVPAPSSTHSSRCVSGRCPTRASPRSAASRTR